MRRLVAIALVTMACGAVTAQAHALSLAFAKGDQYHYTLHLMSKETIDAGLMTMPVETDLTAKETWTVQSVDSSGVADVTLALTNINVRMSSNAGGSSTSTAITNIPIPVQELKIAADGRVLSADGISLSNIANYELFGGGYLLSAVLPDSAVKPGDTWSNSFDQANPSGTGSVHITTKSKYVRDETLKGVTAAVVETTAIDSFDLIAGAGVPPVTASPLPAGQSPFLFSGPVTIKGTVTSDVTTWVDSGSHRILRSRMNSSNEMTISFTLSAGPAASPQPQVLTGPVTLTGTQSLDLEPD